MHPLRLIAPMLLALVVNSAHAESIEVLALGPVTPRFLQVLAPVIPSNPAFPCPTLVLCDAPTLTRICAPQTLTFAVNQPNGCSFDGPVRGECSVAVTADSWSRVKHLYR